MAGGFGMICPPASQHSARRHHIFIVSPNRQTQTVASTAPDILRCVEDVHRALYYAHLRCYRAPSPSLQAP